MIYLGIKLDMRVTEKNNCLILGMALIFLRRNLEMRVTENNNLTRMQDLKSIIQVGLLVLTKGKKNPVLLNFLSVEVYQGIFSQMYFGTQMLCNCMTMIGKTVFFLCYQLMYTVVILIWSFCNTYVKKNQKWTVVFYVTKGKSLWQVGEPAENNVT